MKQQVAFFLLIAVLAILPTAGHCYDPPDPIEIAKRFAQIDAIASSATPDVKQQLISVCNSDKEQVQVRRYAFRLLSRIATTADLKKITSTGTDSPLKIYLDLATIRTEGREKKLSKEAMAKRMLDYLNGYPRTSVEWDMTLWELGFYIADEQLPQKVFPNAAIDRSVELAMLRLDKQSAAYADPVKKAEYLSSLWSNEMPIGREAVDALIARIGDKALPVIEKLLAEHPIKSNPPPWSEETVIYSHSVDVLAGIGGVRAKSILEAYAKSELPYVSGNAKAALRWVDAGVREPLQHSRLFAHPYMDE